MESDLVELHKQFDGYWARLEADVRKATGRLSETVKRAFHVSRPTFAEFQTTWKCIQDDQTLMGSWMRRMQPTGYDAEARAIRAQLQRFREARRPAARRQNDGSREAA